MFTRLRRGDHAPWFNAPVLGGTKNFHLDSVAGHYILLLFVGTASYAPSAEAVALVTARRALFDDERAMFFGVTCDPSDAPNGRIARLLPGIRWYSDFDRSIAKIYGAADKGSNFSPHWVLIDPRLRVVATADIGQGAMILDLLQSLISVPPVDEPAPVLIVPNVFDRDLCRRLVAAYGRDGGEPSGFMSVVDGVTTGIHNHKVKRRSDFLLPDGDPLRDEARERIVSSLVPQMQRAFQFQATRIERYLVCCYDGDDGGGFFKAHRDNTTAGTAHRRFACTINLNAEDFEGGDLTFPEFGPRRYRAPTGGAIIFSCSLLHEATMVTAGRRYAFLPFFYDEAAAKQREQIAQSEQVEASLSTYRAAGTTAVG